MTKASAAIVLLLFASLFLLGCTESKPINYCSEKVQTQKIVDQSGCDAISDCVCLGARDSSGACLRCSCLETSYQCTQPEDDGGDD